MKEIAETRRGKLRQGESCGMKEKAEALRRKQCVKQKGETNRRKLRHERES